jgi:hypothetical protein
MVAIVKLADGTDYTVKKLLADGDTNVKMAKSNASGKGYMTVGLSLSPANESGFQTCASSSAGCRKACLYTSGMGRFANVKRARVAKTVLFFKQRDTFLAMLVAELQKWQRKADKAGKILAVRLNVVSDIPWEVVAPQLFAAFPNVQFYDYTKHYKRMIRFATKDSFPANYHLTFSRSENNGDECYCVLKSGGNVTVVYDNKKLPPYWNGFRVINGDETDLRFLDESGVVVGLYAKGEGKKDTSGFIVQTGLSILKR